MQDRHIFEYSVIRVVPRVEREEFLNVGVILYCKAQQFLEMRYFLNEPKLLVLAPQLDLEELNRNLQAFQAISEGSKDSGPIGQLSLPERFRWLTATRSTILQPTRPHPGLSHDIAATLDKLFREQVL